MDPDSISSNSDDPQSEVKPDVGIAMADTSSLADDCARNIGDGSDIKKRPVESISSSTDQPPPSNNTKANKRRKNQSPKAVLSDHSQEESQDTSLNELTTIDDLTTIDASTYLAWVRGQADSLPSVFVADANDDDNDNATNGDSAEAIVSATTIKKMKAEKEEPIDGSMATLQILLSKQMDILPPRSERHLPPFDAVIADIYTDSNTGCEAVAAKEASKVNTTDPTPPINNITSGNKCSNWITSTVSNFSKLRSYLEYEHTKHKHQRSQSKERRIAVPRMKDRAAWHVFCLGREEAFGNVGGYFEDSDDGEGGGDAVGGNEEEKNVIAAEEKGNTGEKTGEDVTSDNEQSTTDINLQQQQSYNPNLVPLKGYPPTTSLLLQLDQVLTRTLFQHHVHYLCEWKFPLTQSRSSWMYALLARMEKPWHREECCAVRRVLRECCSRRWELVLPLNGGSALDADGQLGMMGEESKQELLQDVTGDVDAKSNTGHTEGDAKAWEQLALLNTLIAVTGIYYEQGASSGGDGIDSLFKVAPSKTDERDVALK